MNAPRLSKSGKSGHISALNNGALRERERIVEWLIDYNVRLSGLSILDIAAEILAGQHLPQPPLAPASFATRVGLRLRPRLRSQLPVYHPCYLRNSK